MLGPILPIPLAFVLIMKRLLKYKINAFINAMQFGASAHIATCIFLHSTLRCKLLCTLFLAGFYKMAWLAILSLGQSLFSAANFMCIVLELHSLLITTVLLLVLIHLYLKSNIL